MIGACLFAVFVLLMLAGVPIGVALGVGGALAIGLSNLDTPNWGLLAVPQNFYASLTKYPLLALPMFVLVGSIFDRSGIAQRLVNFAVALIGRGPGMLPVVAILVAMFLGGTNKRCLATVCSATPSVSPTRPFLGVVSNTALFCSFHCVKSLGS